MSSPETQTLRLIDSPLPGGKWLVRGRQLLAGVGNNAFRAWVFPFRTPSGFETVQEFAFDHPFHNGLFVGQANVLLGDVLSNFWAMQADPLQDGNPLMADLGQTLFRETPEVSTDQSRWTVRYRTTWIGSDGAPVLDEDRTFSLQVTADAVLCEIVSAKGAAYGALHFGKTKASAIGARVHPQLLPVLGGEVLAFSGETRSKVDSATAIISSADAIAYENDLPGLGRHGICMLSPGDSSVQKSTGPWIPRHYGMAMFAPVIERDISLPAGQAWTTSLRFAAYDGAISAERIERWRANS